jgi:hypothetical protein
MQLPNRYEDKRHLLAATVLAVLLAMFLVALFQLLASPGRYPVLPY